MRKPRRAEGRIKVNFTMNTIIKQRNGNDMDCTLI